MSFLIDPIDVWEFEFKDKKDILKEYFSQTTKLNSNYIDEFWQVGSFGLNPIEIFFYSSKVYTIEDLFNPSLELIRIQTNLILDRLSKDPLSRAIQKFKDGIYVKDIVAKLTNHVLPEIDLYQYIPDKYVHYISSSLLKKLLPDRRKGVVNHFKFGIIKNKYVV